MCYINFVEGNFFLAFSLSPIGPKRFQKLLRICGSAKRAWQAGSADFKKAGVGEIGFAKFKKFRSEFDLNEYAGKLEKARAEFIPSDDKYYPKRLENIDAPPIGLFIKGNKNLLTESKMIAVVGARKITSYGRQVTENLVNELCSAGLVIISGMALGVDGVAHKSAIGSGSTIAVLGCGVDCPYPRENEKLYEEILDSGGLIISEYPLGMSANRGTFPARNRIIAGLSLAVLITEAAEDSGSLITASNAVSQGKTVFAVPGPISSRMSNGTAKLIKEGAALVSSANDILDLLKVRGKSGKVKSRDQRFGNLNKYEQRLLEVLENEERTIDEISKLTKIPIAKLSTILSEMELRGLIENSGGKFSAVFV